jgi:hypothetical protein
LEEDGWDAQFETLDAKLDVLNTSMKDIQYRVNELRARPQAIADLNQTLNLTRGFMAHMKNATANVSADELPWYTVKEIEELEKLYNETQTWLAEKVAEQADAPLTAAPVLKVCESASNWCLQLMQVPIRHQHFPTRTASYHAR